MSVKTGTIPSPIQSEQVKIDKLETWIAQKVSNEKMTIIIIKLIRMLQGKNKGIKNSIYQCDQMRVENDIVNKINKINIQRHNRMC